MQHSHPNNQNIRQKPPFKLGFVNWFTILIMACAGVIAFYLHSKKNVVPAPLPDTQPQTHAGNKKTLPALIYPIDLDSIIIQGETLVTPKNSVAIFEHGTCVLIMEPVTNPVGTAKSSIQMLSSPYLQFEVKSLPNNNYLIIFNKYLFYFLFAKELSSMKGAIFHDSRLDLKSNDSRHIREMPEFQRRLGKLARLFVLEDSKSLVVSKIMTHTTPEEESPDSEN